MRKRRIALTLLLVGMMLTAGGCVAAVIAGAAAAGTVAYTRGDYESIERESVEELHNAVLKALEDLKIAVDSKSMDALGVLFEARTLEGK